MTHFEIKISLDEDKTLNEVTAAIHSGLFAADLDPLGVSVQEFVTEPMYELEAEEVARARREVQANLIASEHRGYNYAPGTEDFIQALKENGDRYRG